jgi:phosphoadenosine phosphosulfate reductase
MNIDVSEYIRVADRMPAEEMIRWFIGLFPGEVAFSTSLGAEDQVITQMMAGAGKEVKIFTLDTGRLFQETYDLLDITEKKYGIHVDVCFPDAAEVSGMVHERGINLFYDSIENRKLCCDIRKVRPLRKALSGMKVWITGVRQSQAVSRAEMKHVSWDRENNLVKVNPLLDWTSEQVWEYIRAHGIPFNPLHDKGYPSIGCVPCTRAVAPGEDDRAGRWWWESPENRECGLHVRKTP